MNVFVHLHHRCRSVLCIESGMHSHIMAGAATVAACHMHRCTRTVDNSRVCDHSLFKCFLVSRSAGTVIITFIFRLHPYNFPAYCPALFKGSRSLFQAFVYTSFYCVPVLDTLSLVFYCIRDLYRFLQTFISIVNLYCRGFVLCLYQIFLM